MNKILGVVIVIGVLLTIWNTYEYLQLSKAQRKELGGLSKLLINWLIALLGLGYILSFYL